MSILLNVVELCTFQNGERRQRQERRQNAERREEKGGRSRGQEEEEEEAAFPSQLPVDQRYSVPNNSRPVVIDNHQGGHGTGKTGNLVLTFSRQGKHREFCFDTGKNFETQGKYFSVTQGKI